MESMANMQVKLPKISKNLGNSIVRVRTQSNNYNYHGKANSLYIALIQQQLVHRPNQHKLEKYLENNQIDEQKQPNFSRGYLSTTKIRSSQYIKKKSLALNKLNKEQLSVIKNHSQSNDISQSRALMHQRREKYKSPQKQEKYIKITEQYESYKLKSEQFCHKNSESEAFFADVEDLKIKTSSFINQLRKFNIFFQRLSHLMSMYLLKIGQIKIVKSKQYLYKQSQPAQTFFIILWGQLKLKTKFSNIVKYCTSGDSISEQVMTTDTQDKIGQLRFILINGIKPRLQSAKAVIDSGVLELTPSKFQLLKRQMTKVGQKDKFLVAYNIIRWSFVKKARFHKS